MCDFLHFLLLQVYLRINAAPTQAQSAVVIGTVIVAKNPCFHPGDVRKLQACPLLC